MPELCVYGVAPRRARIGGRGVRGERLRGIRVGAVQVVVGEVRGAPAPSDRNLRTYHRIVTALWRRTPALLPARFGAIVADDRALALAVGAREPVLRRLLRRVRQRGQMTVRIVRPAASDDAGSADVVPVRYRSGGEYLRARAAAERRAREIPAFAACRAAVARWVRAERVERAAGVATIYHLVPRASVARYRTALEAAAHDSGVRLVVTGPWPAFAFSEAAE